MYKIATLVLAAFTITFAFFSCSPGSSSSSSDGVTVVPGSSGSYQGAGSRWEADFTTTDFNLKHFPTVSATTEDLSVSGTYVQYSSSFRLLTVTAAAGTGAPSPGAQAYGYEVPGFAFFLKPVGSDSEPIVMLDSGVCPPATSFNANWIIARFDPGVSMTVTQDNFGSAVFNTSLGASSTATITQRNPVDGGIVSGSPQVAVFDYGTCGDSILTFSPAVSETVDMFFTSNGGALVHSYNGSSHDSIIFAAPRHSGDVTQADLAGTYSALVFDDSQTSNKLFPAKLVIPTSGAATGTEISDIATDTLSSNGISIENFAAISGTNGLFTASIDPLSQNGRLSCTFFELNSKNVIACNGFGSASGGHEPFFFLAQER